MEKWHVEWFDRVNIFFGKIDGVENSSLCTNILEYIGMQLSKVQQLRMLGDGQRINENEVYNG